MKTRTPKRTATIYQIAERAGVSSSTVARALNGENKEKSSGSASRAERIRQIAEQMGYRPNWRARAFAEGKTRSIGLFQPKWWALLDGVNTGIVEGFVSELYKRQYHVVLVPIGEGGEWQRMLSEQRLDGCAMLQHLVNAQQVVETLERYEIPAVMINNAEDGESQPGVLIDDYNGAILAVKHLKLLGHKKIGFYIADSAEDHYSIHERVRGFKSALGIDPSDDSMVWREDQQSLLRRLVDGGEDQPTALICYSHFEAIPLLHSLNQFGVQVPRDLSVLCFNDIYPAEFLNPPLTTVTYDTKKLGRISAQMLLRQIEDGREGVDHEKITMKQHLIVRGSTGPAPSNDV